MVVVVCKFAFVANSQVCFCEKLEKIRHLTKLSQIKKGDTYSETMCSLSHACIHCSVHIHLHLSNKTKLSQQTNWQLIYICTIFKRHLSRQEFPQKNAKAVNIIFDCPWTAGISKHLRCHISNSSTSSASGCLCCSLSLPFCQTKITYL